VSWHADSTLDHFSTIGVYHCTSPLPCTATTSAAPCNTAPSKGSSGTKGSKSTRTSTLGKRGASEEGVSKEETETAVDPVEEVATADASEKKEVETEKVEETTAQKSSDEPDLSWRLALRVWYDAEGPNAAKAITSRAGEMQTAAGSRIAPALAVPLPSGACYFLLDDFNHHHQHSGKLCLIPILPHNVNYIFVFSTYTLRVSQFLLGILTDTPVRTVCARLKGTLFSRSSRRPIVCFRSDRLIIITIHFNGGVYSSRRSVQVLCDFFFFKCVSGDRQAAVPGQEHPFGAVDDERDRI